MAACDTNQLFQDGKCYSHLDAPIAQVLRVRLLMNWLAATGTTPTVADLLERGKCFAACLESGYDVSVLKAQLLCNIATAIEGRGSAVNCTEYTGTVRVENAGDTGANQDYTWSFATSTFVGVTNPIYFLYYEVGSQMWHLLDDTPPTLDRYICPNAIFPCGPWLPGGDVVLPLPHPVHFV